MVRTIARQVEQVVARNPQTRDVQFDWNEPVRTLGVQLDQEKARALGLSPAEVAMATQSLMQGATLTQLRDGEELIDVVAEPFPRSGSTSRP